MVDNLFHSSSLSNMTCNLNCQQTSEKHGMLTLKKKRQCGVGCRSLCDHPEGWGLDDTIGVDKLFCFPEPVLGQ